MEKYNYREAVCDDIRAWLDDNEDWKANYLDDDGKWLTKDNRDDVADDMFDVLWDCDSVTGNGSGSYTFNEWEAEENLCHNLSLLSEALDTFGCDASYIQKEGVEACDVTIRCFVLRDCIEQVLDELLNA